MVDSIMYQEDGYVVLANNQPEELMTKPELLSKLEAILPQVSDLPTDITRFDSPELQANYIIDNYCELSLNEGEYIQWYVTRWEK